MAAIHACFLGKTEELLEQGSLGEVILNATDKKPKSKPFLLRSLGEVAKSFPTIVTSKRKQLVENFVKNFDQVYKEINQQPLTLVHYDPHPGKFNIYVKCLQYDLMSVYLLRKLILQNDKVKYAEINLKQHMRTKCNLSEIMQK